MSFSRLPNAQFERDVAGLLQNLGGSTLRPRPVVEKARIAKALLEKVWPLLESGAVKLVLHQTFPLSEAAAAHRLMESSTHIGKIVLTLDSATAATHEP